MVKICKVNETSRRYYGRKKVVCTDERKDEINKSYEHKNSKRALNSPFVFVVSFLENFFKIVNSICVNIYTKKI